MGRCLSSSFNLGSSTLISIKALPLALVPLALTPQPLLDTVYWLLVRRSIKANQSQPFPQITPRWRQTVLAPMCGLVALER